MISVIVPTYNEENVIGACLESLSKQSHKDYEVIIVDDGSDDNSKSKIQKAKLQFKSKKLRYFEQSHKGPGEARNLGAKHARGDILVFVDADMTFDKDFLTELVKPIEKGDVKGTNSNEEYVSNWDNIWARNWNYNQGIRFSRRGVGTSEERVFRAIIKREFERVGGFDRGGHYTDDWSLARKLGYLPKIAKAKFYHANPSGLVEVFKQARWTGKREYKLGFIGSIVSLVRTCLPLSLVIGLIKSFAYLSPTFLIFKIVYDFGNFVGIFEYIYFGKGAK